MSTTSADSNGLRKFALDFREITALVIYLTLAALFLARGIIRQFSAAYIGKNEDPPMLMWEMSWWLHTIKHGQNPLFTNALWAPKGVNLTWTPNMPLLSIIVAPLNAVVGPIFTYNMVCLLSCALAAWCAFILCRYATRAYWPSLIGGYVFGFSAYMLGQLAGHMNLTLVFPIPLFVLLLICTFRAETSSRLLVTGLVFVLVAQFLLFMELFATLTFFAGIGFMAFVAVGSRADRARCIRLLPTVALSYAIALLLLSPYFYLMATSGFEPGPVHLAALHSTELLNLVLPTPTMELGRLSMLEPITRRYVGNIYEADGYLGIAFLPLIVVFARRYWSEGWGRLLVVMLVVAVVLSFGPFLFVGGRPIIPMPGMLLSAMPLLNKALPARLMLYAFLPLALMTAVWLASSSTPLWTRGFAAVLMILSILPNLSPSFWTTVVDIPPFFRNGLYTEYLTRDEIVLTLPYSPMMWQLESRWYFRMVGGYVGIAPRAFRQWPVLATFYQGGPTLPAPGDQLKAFMSTHRVTAVLVDDSQGDLWLPLTATLDTSPMRVGGMSIYRVPLTELAPWKNATPLEMEKRSCKARFDALVLAAHNYLVHGGSPATLTLMRVRELGLMPAGWALVPAHAQPPWIEGGVNVPQHAPDARFFAGMWLGADERGGVQIGVTGRYAALRAILQQYRSDAVNFVPRNLNDVPRDPDDDRRPMLMMTLDGGGLARAATKASADLDATVRNSPHG